MSQLHLMQSLNFTTDDLNANREHKMSSAQREYFTPKKMNPFVTAVFYGHLALIVGIFAVMAILTGSMAMWWITLLVGLLLYAPFTYAKAQNRMRPALQDDLAKGVVTEARGYVFLEEKMERKKPYIELTVDGVTFKLKPKRAAHFRHEGEYCVYYLPGSKTLLSAEPID